METNTNTVTKTALLTAVAFVVGTRFILHGTLLAISWPYRTLNSLLPSTNTTTFTRIERLKEYVASKLTKHLPGDVEFRGNWVILLKTTYGQQQLDALVDSTPDRLVDIWLRLSVATTLALLVTWATVLLIGLVIAAKTILELFPELISKLATFDWGYSHTTRPTPNVDLTEILIEAITSIPEIAIALGIVALVVAITVISFWVASLALLPGLAFHEFGHYAAIRKGGKIVEYYGLVLTGPILGGAFVSIDDEELESMPAIHQFRTWSAGIGTDLLWSTFLISSAMVLSTDPVGLLTAFSRQNYIVLSAQPVPALLLAVGTLEIVNGFLNALPLGPVDGGQFMKTAEEIWWGYEDDFDFTDKIAQLLNIANRKEAA